MHPTDTWSAPVDHPGCLHSRPLPRTPRRHDLDRQQRRANFDLHKGCGTSSGVFSHTWIGDTRSTTTCASGGNWAAGTPQALSYWPVLGTTQVDELWGLTEQPGQRTIFAVGFTDPAVQALH
jgi:hypothetical protein